MIIKPTADARDGDDDEMTRCCCLHTNLLEDNHCLRVVSFLHRFNFRPSPLKYAVPNCTTRGEEGSSRSTGCSCLFFGLDSWNWHGQNFNRNCKPTFSYFPELFTHRVLTDDFCLLCLRRLGFRLIPTQFPIL